ncbi:hypothetical protein APE_1186.1 [Aeropyrum pernix K1]|uniref:Glycosyl transferase family 1 domain-containing protein n=1 Tax=Aeropyrum pernix (strain ATCC 700893 / DSM 11879 / JCM 9820 / NBRC 100138 / K1) TaxID=272557 RepID=Q9YCS5_AERPE|nr:glycosyltransferase [Aeropyrum pernix]BAA80172.2 hypothetical protein APE_1186.1 [Aeropyrum pernix K1]
MKTPLLRKDNVEDSMNIIFVNTSSSKEVIGGGDIRLLGLLYTLSNLRSKKIKLYLLSDKHYIESIRYWLYKSNLVKGNNNIPLSDDFALKISSYLPPYKRVSFIIRLILLLLTSIRNLTNRGRIIRRSIIVINNNQLYQYIIPGLDVLSNGMVVYIQTPPFNGDSNFIKTLMYRGFLPLLRLIGKFKRIIIFVFNPIDFVFLNTYFREEKNIKIVITTNGVFKYFVNYNSVQKVYDVIYIGRLDPSKGSFKNFITFLRNLAERNLNIRAAIITSCLKEELPYIERSLSGIKQYNNVKVEVLVNKTPIEVYRIISRSRALVMLSTLDVFNLAILESLVHGIHVIALNNPRIETAYERICDIFECKPLLQERFHIVDNIDEAVKEYLSVTEKERQVNEHVRVHALRLAQFLDWRYVVLKEVMEVVKWVYRK